MVLFFKLLANKSRKISDNYDTQDLKTGKKRMM